MDWQTLPYLIPYLISAAISATVGLYAWRRRAVTGAAPFALGALAQVSWTLGHMFELASPSLEAKIFWDDTQWVGGFVWPMAFLAFALDYTERKPRHPKRTWGLLSIVPVIFMLLVISDGLHGLIRPAAWLVPGEPFSALVYDFTIPIWIMALYIYGLILSSFCFLVRAFFQSHRLYRSQVAIIIVGTSIPTIGTFLPLVGVTPTFQRDIMPLTSAIGNLIIAWGLFRYRLLDVVPVARAAVIESMSDVVVVLDAQGRVVDLNPAAQKVIGRVASEVIGVPSSQVFSNWPDLVKRHRGAEKVHTEIAVGAGEEQRHFALNISSLRDRRGRLTGHVIIVHDITERARMDTLRAQAEQALQRSHDELEQRIKERTSELEQANTALQAEIAEREQAESALRQERDRAQQYLDIAEVMLVALSEEGKIALINRKGCRILGYEREEELLGQDWFDTCLPPEVKEEARSVFSQLMAGETGPIEYFENPVLTSSSERRMIAWHNTLLRDETGKIVGTLSSGENITERIQIEAIRAQAEKALRASEARNRALLSAIPDLMFQFSRSGVFLDFRAASETSLYAPPEAFVDKSLFDVFPPALAQRAMDCLERAIQTQEVQLLEYQLTFGDQARDFEARFVVSGEDQVLAIVRDITERKQAEAKIERALRETHLRLEVSQALATAQTEDEVMDVLIGQAGIYPEAQITILTHHDEGGERFATVHRVDSFDSTLTPPFKVGMCLPTAQFKVSQLYSPDKPLISANILTDDRFDPRSKELAKQTGATSFAAIPITAGNEWLGMIFAEAEPEGYFDEQKLNLYRTLAEQGAAALQIARLNDSIQHSLKETQVRLEVSQTLATAQTEDEVLDVLIQQMEIYPNTRPMILTMVPEAEELTTVLRRQACYECTLDLLPEGLQFPISHFPRFDPSMITATFLSSNLLEDKNAGPALNEMARQTGVRSMFTLPFMAGDQLLAVLSVSSPEVGYFDEQKIQLYQTLAEQGAAALRAARLRETIRESRQRLSLLVQQSPLGIIEWDIDFQVAAWNPAAEQIFGYTSEEALGRHAIGILVPKDVQPLVNQIWQDLLAQQGGAHSINDNVTKDGRRITCEWFNAPLLDADGQIIGAVSLVEDITKRKQVEEEREQLLAQVQEQAQRVQHIVNTVPEGVILLDPDLCILLANPLGKQYLATLTDVQLGDPLTRLGDRAIEELLTSPPQGLWHEVAAKHRSFQAITRPIENGPTPKGWVLVVRDVTQQREVERRVQQQERLATVGQLAAGMAHDFNNIMAVVTLYAGMSLRTPDLSEKVRERLQTIDEQARRASRLIQQILDFSRRAVLERGPLDLTTFLNEQVKLLQRTLPEHIQIGLTYGKDEYIIHADPTRIQQAIMNLATNARDAMPEGGRLRFGLERVTFGEHDIPPLPEMKAAGSAGAGPAVDEWIRLTVTDTGSGIPPDIQPHVFDPFFTTKEPGKGTGLGLAQVYGIVKQHEGYIDFVTEPDRGTTFTLYLPALAVQPPQAPAAESESLIRGQGQTILVVEDDAATRQALVEGLKILNYQVLEAVNGRQALAIFEQHAGAIDLVLSDVVMPQMGGRALLHALRERDPGVRVVLLTGHPLEEQEFEGLRALGLRGWVLKPLSVGQLARVVAEALGNPCEG